MDDFSFAVGRIGAIWMARRFAMITVMWRRHIIKLFEELVKHLRYEKEGTRGREGFSPDPLVPVGEPALKALTNRD